MSIFLTDDEIAGICCPLEQPAAKIRYLKSLGLEVRRKPNGHPLVSRNNFEHVMAGRQDVAVLDQQQPNITADVIALRQRWANKGSKNGTQALGR